MERRTKAQDGALADMHANYRREAIITAYRSVESLPNEDFKLLIRWKHAKKMDKAELDKHIKSYRDGLYRLYREQAQDR